MYHNHSSPGVLQLPWCATTSLVCYNFPVECGTTSYWNAYNYVTTSTGMLPLPLVCCNIDNKHLLLDWKLLSAVVTIRVSRPQQDSDGRLQKCFARYLSL